LLSVLSGSSSLFSLLSVVGNLKKVSYLKKEKKTKSPSSAEIKKSFYYETLEKFIAELIGIFLSLFDLSGLIPRQANLPGTSVLCDRFRGVCDSGGRD
jgi:hypothetical protein